MTMKRLLLCLLMSVALILTFIPTISFGMNDDEHVISFFEVDSDGNYPASFSEEGDGGYYAQLEHGAVHGLNHEEDDQGSLFFIAKEGQPFDLFIDADEGWVVSGVYGEYGDNQNELEVEYVEDNECWSFEMPTDNVNIYIEFSEEEENNEPRWQLLSQNGDDSLYISKDKPTVELTVEPDFSAYEEGEELPKLDYQWYHYQYVEEGYTDVLIENEISETYVASEVGEYRCTATDAEGKTDSVWFYVSYQTDWTASAEGGTGEDGDRFLISKSKPTIELKVRTDTTGCDVDPQLTYQWCNEDWDEIPTATSDTYNATDVGTYYCIVTDKDNHSTIVEFKVSYQTDWTIWSEGDVSEDGDFVISKNKPTVKLKVGSDISNCVENPQLKYQWYRKVYDEEDESYSDVAIEGEISDTYTATQEGEYYCTVTDKDNHSAETSFSVYYQTDWSAQAEQEDLELSRNSESGVELKVLIDKSGCTEDPGLVYQWYDNESEEIEGEISDTFTAYQIGSYYCRVTDRDGHFTDVDFYVQNGFSALSEELKNSADVIQVDEEKPVDTGVADGLFKFVAPKAGLYMFYSKQNDTDEADPVGRVLKEDGTEIARNDDDLGNRNFQIVFPAEKDEIFYLQAIDYEGSATFTVALMDSDIKSISYVPSADPLLAERDCDESSRYEINYNYRVGAKLTLHKDGSDVVYVCKTIHSEEEGDYEDFVLETDPEEIMPGWIEFDMDKSFEASIAPGSTKQITTTVSYAGLKSNEFTTTIKFVLNHGDLSKTEAVAATCEKSGNNAYWYCSKCKKYYGDAEGTKEIVKDSWTIPAGHKLEKFDKVAPTTTKEGTEAYWKCSKCGKMFSDAGGKNQITAPVKIAKLPDPAQQKGADGTALGKGASAQAAEKAITSMKNDNDPAGSAFSVLQLKSTKQAKTSITLNWIKAKGAVKYVVYGNMCGKANKMKKIATAKSNKYVVKKAVKKLVKGKNYKFIVVALDKNNKVVSTSKLIHVATAGTKVGNYKSVTVTKKVIKAAAKLKKGKTLKLAAKAVPVAKKKVAKHCAVRYESTNKKIATVSAKGVVKGVKKGTCYVYAYAQNGVAKKIKVVVK